MDFMIRNGLAGAALSTAVPSDVGFYSIAGVADIAPIGPGTGIAVSLENYGPSEIGVQVDVSPPFESTRQRYKGPWDTARTVFELVADASAAVIEVLGLVADKTYFTRIRAVVSDSGHAITAVFYLRHTAVTV
jgi:hypothetical protein